MGNERNRKLDEIRRFERLLEKQTGKAVRPYRADSYVNLLNRYGTSKDTTEHYHFQQEPPVPDDLLTSYYEGNGLFAKIIDTPAEEAIKHGFELSVKDQQIEDFYKGALDELDWEETAMTAIKWTRLFGGCIVVMLINDGRGLDEPLDWKNIQSIDDLRVYDRSVIQEDTSSMFDYRPDDPFRTRSSRLGMPEYYDVFSRYGHFRVHDSRCLVFQNGTLPENTTNSIYQLWGMPEYIRINRAIRDAEVAHGSAIKLLDRSIQAVYKMKDLAAELATEEGEDRVLRRLQTIDMARGLLNSITIDAEGEDYDFRTFQFTGVSEVVDSACNYLSALTSIPQTILFGRSPAGMNSTGESDLENWYNYLERIQSRMVKKNLRYLLSIIFQAGVACGEVDEVPDISIEFNPLWNMSESEKAAIDQQKAQTQQVRAQTAQLYMDAQVIDPTEVRRKLADSDEFDIENMLDEYESEEDLFANMPQGSDDDMFAGGMPGEPEQQEAPAEAEEQAPQKQGTQPEYTEGVDVEEHNTDPGTEGSAPTAAPAATKLPEDMSDEEKEKAKKKDGRVDGGPGSGNFGHKGRPGEIGGSARSAASMNSDIQEALAKGKEEFEKAVSSTVKGAETGAKLEWGDITVEKIGDNKWLSNEGDAMSDDEFGQFYFRYPVVKITGIPQFREVSSEEVAEAKNEAGEIEPDETSVQNMYKAIQDYQDYGYATVNEPLRNGEELTGAAKEIDDGLQKAFKEMGTTDNGASSLYRASDATITYDAFEETGLGSIIAKKFGGDTTIEEAWNTPDIRKAIKDNLIGYEFTDEGYVSTSALYKSAKEFSHDDDRMSRYGCSEMIRINARGASVLDLGSDGAIAGSNENEVIINKGSTFRITDVLGYDSKSKSLMLYCDYVNKKSDSRTDEGNSNSGGNTVSNPPKSTLFEANDDDNPFTTHRPKHGSVGVLVVSDGCILSGIRKGGFNPGLVCGPGGHVEKGETHEQAAIRETQEEFGITPKDLIQIGYGPWEPDTGLKPAVFLATEYEGNLKNIDGEMGDLRFRSLAELREMDKTMFQPFADGIDLLLRVIGPDHFDGGPGSGNHGHKGVPGQRGGSAPSNGNSKGGSIDSKYLPDVGVSQGLNTYKAKYLRDKGFDEDKIKQLSGYVSYHIAHPSSANDDEMTLFAAENEDLIKESAKYELAAIVERQKAKNVVRARYEEEPIEVTGDMDVYRKGDNEDTLLSWTDNPVGTTLYAGTDHEIAIGWDQKSTVKELVEQGIYPVAGIGEFQNFYGENEVTFINTNGVQEKAANIKEARAKEAADKAKEKARSEKQARLFVEELDKIPVSASNEKHIKKMKELASAGKAGRAIDYAYENGMFDDAVKAIRTANSRLEEDSRSDSLLSPSELASAFNSAVSENGFKSSNLIDKSAKSGIIKSRTTNTCKEAFLALSPEDIAFIAEEFWVDVPNATEEELLDVLDWLRVDGGPGSGNHGHKGRPGERGGSASNGGYLTAGSVEDLNKAKASGQIKMKLNRGKQSKHFVGTKQYKAAVARGEYVGTFSISESEIDKLIQEKTGTGDVFIDSRTSHVKETVDCGRTVGSYAARNGKEYPTSRITIHHSKNGYHAVPASSDGKRGTK